MPRARPGRAGKAALRLACLLAVPLFARSQSPPNSAPAPSVLDAPIALVRLDHAPAETGVTVTGALDVTADRAAIGTSGTVTAGGQTAEITLPHRGLLRLCATTRVGLSMDPAHAGSDRSGLMMALDRGALETSFHTGSDSDVILTPDFRILISGPGQSAVAVRLGDHGDTCVENPGTDAPYVTVSSVFDGGAYRVQSNQRVLFQHGSLSEVVDSEKESCGCPHEPASGPNAFPEAESAGLAPLHRAPPNAESPGVVHAQVEASLSYDGRNSAMAKATVTTTGSPAPAAELRPGATLATTPAAPAKPGLFRRIGHFFRRVFGG